MRRTAVLFVALLFMTPFSFSERSFEQHSYPATGSRLLRADFNNDGKPDLLVYRGSELEAPLNNGTPALPILSFAAATTRRMTAVMETRKAAPGALLAAVPRQGRLIPCFFGGANHDY